MAVRQFPFADDVACTEAQGADDRLFLQNEVDVQQSRFAWLYLDFDAGKYRGLKQVFDAFPDIPVLVGISAAHADQGAIGDKAGQLPGLRSASAPDRPSTLPQSGAAVCRPGSSISRQNKASGNWRRKFLLPCAAISAPGAQAQVEAVAPFFISHGDREMAGDS